MDLVAKGILTLCYCLRGVPFTDFFEISTVQAPLDLPTAGMVVAGRIPVDRYFFPAIQRLEAEQRAPGREADDRGCRNGTQCRSSVVADLIGELRGISRKAFLWREDE